MPGAAAVTMRESTDAAPQIESIAARAVLAPLARPIRTAVGHVPAAPLVLIDVRAGMASSDALHLRLHARSRCGRSCTSSTISDASLPARAVAPADLMREFNRRFRLVGWQGFIGMALSGLDMAFWDALARARNEPLVASARRRAEAPARL